MYNLPTCHGIMVLQFTKTIMLRVPLPKAVDDYHEMEYLSHNEFPVYCLLTVMTEYLYYGHSLNSWVPSTASRFHKPFQRHQLCTAVPFNIFQSISDLPFTLMPLWLDSFNCFALSARLPLYPRCCKTDV